MTTVLVSGAGVAGLTLAYWLRRRGLVPTVVERAPAWRLGGQPIDIRGSALGVVERMGLLDEVRKVRTHMRGMSMVDAEGLEVQRSTDFTASTGPLGGADVEILRDDLMGLLHESARDGVEYLYGDGITALDEDDSGVRVSFERGPARTFDLVVGADGLHSRVRQLAFGPDGEFTHHLGSYLGVCTGENFPDLDNWQIWHMGPALTYGLYPVRDNAEIRVTFIFQSAPIDYDFRDAEAQKTLVADRFARMGGEVPRMLQAMWESSDFYFVAMAQIRMDHWSKGRVALVGDAGYCASPLSGQGTSLALGGAYVLAEELGKAKTDHRAAFARYEERMASYVTLNQTMAAGGLSSDEPAIMESLGADNTSFMERFERIKNALVLDD